MSAFVITLAALATQTKRDPSKALEELSALKKSGASVDVVKARAMLLIKGVEADRVALNQGEAWAKVFIEATEFKTAVQLARRNALALTEPSARTDAWFTVLDAANKGCFADDIVAATRNCRLTSVSQSYQYVSVVPGRSGATILALKGPDAAAKYIANSLEAMDWSVAKFPSANRQALVARMRAVQVFYLARAGKIDVARKVLADANLESPYYSSSFETVARSIDILQKPIGDFNPLTSFGTFPGLNAYRGKVILLDFFAHWCGPCIATFPDTKKLYAKYHSKGLEVVGVTQDYGYFGKEQNLKPEDEREKFKAFMTKFDLPWTTVVVPWLEIWRFGIFTIPAIVLVDKKGIVRVFDDQSYRCTIIDPHYLERIVQRLLDE